MECRTVTEVRLYVLVLNSFNAAEDKKVCSTI